MRRTRGSVRASLSATVRLATVVSEAAETTYLRPSGEETTARKSLRLQASTAVGGSGWMAGPTQSELPQASSTGQRAKGAERLRPKGDAVGCSTDDLEHTDFKTAGVKAGTKPSMLLERNTVNPPSRLDKAGVIARCAVGMSGRGSWKKPRPPGNRVDRSCNITPPRKHSGADFQPVVDDERAGRTFSGGDCK